jgi:hypothetical protein
MESEVWTTSEGVSVELRPVPWPPLEADEDPWFPESPGHLPPVKYHLVAVATGEVVDERVVFPVAPWSPYDAVSDLLLRDGYEPPPLTEAELAECEHGLSAALCAGPGHYPPDGADW